MTKRRAPLTFENALTTVASVLGWTAVAKICGSAESTVRAWSDPDITAKISLEAAWKLDMEFQGAGGDSAPFLSCYATRLRSEIGEIIADRSKLLAGVAAAAKEGGEAVAATIAAADPKATTSDFVIAERELEEAIYAGRNLIMTVRAMLRKLMNGRAHEIEEEPPEGFDARDLGGGLYSRPQESDDLRALEVALPNTS